MVREEGDTRLASQIAESTLAISGVTDVTARSPSQPLSHSLIQFIVPISCLFINQQEVGNSQNHYFSKKYPDSLKVLMSFPEVHN